ncbi:MAG: GNAT family N-acetyltransferase [Clostridiales bacterium]|jgi:GNAT superfamily N-acetyltransferase|nr:GNAT family N-acetyltransferase [Clostridiales bacterium]
MKFELDQTEFAAFQIGLIDSGERNIFLETVNTNKQIDTNIFYCKGIKGVCYSCNIYGGVRIHISFDEDTDLFNEDVASFVQSTMQKSRHESCLIWIWNKNYKIIDFLKERFYIQPDCGVYYYASIEFIMRRETFNKTCGSLALDIRPYEEKYIDEYLYLLDGAMTFTSPPTNFTANRDNYARQFDERSKTNSFEAFWKGDQLIGLYWRKNAEIEIMAVANDHQRKGYGSEILTRAIEMIFKNTTGNYAYLYAVDWNKKGQSFYKKYGMEQNGHSYLLRLNNLRV